MRKRLQARVNDPYAVVQAALTFPIEEGRIIVQTRQSDGSAYGNNSTEIQAEKMVDFARSLCVNPDKQIICVDENMREDGTIISVSGALPPEKRHGLLRTYALIGDNPKAAAEERIVMVLCYAEDRLFRDDTGMYYNEFMDILRRYETLLMVYTSRKLYDFSNGMDKRLFRIMCEFASEDLKLRTIRLQGARQHMTEKGQYAHGTLPAGLIRHSSTNRLDPLYSKPVEYTPWAEPVRQLFKRYYECGNLTQVFTEVADKPIFPPLPEGMKNYSGFRAGKKNGTSTKGYTITRHSIKFMLINPLYIGYWYNPLTGIWIEDNHPAIVPPEHFWYAFRRLSPVLIDGSPNPECVQTSVSRNSNNLGDDDGLFHGLFVGENDGIHFTRRVIKHKDKHVLSYQMYDYNNGIDSTCLLFIRADELDNALLPILTAKLKDTKELEDFRKFGVALKEQQQAKNTQLHNLLNENEEALRATELRIDTLTEPALLIKQQTKYQLLLARNAELKQEIQENEHPTSKRNRRILTYYELIELLGPCFEKMEHQDRRTVVESTIDSIGIKILSPRFLLVQINWLAWPEQVFLYQRENFGAGNWSNEELATLKRLYPTASAEELLLAIPRRSWVGIKRARKEHQIPGHGNRWAPYIVPEWAEHGYCAEDMKILEKYGLSCDCPKLVEITGPYSVNDR